MSQTEKKTGFFQLELAYHSSQFRWLMAGQTVSITGFIMAMLADGWLVLMLTDSPFWVGVAAGVQGIGLIGFGLIGGVVVDRIGGRRALIMARAGMAIAVLILGVLTIGEWVALWHILLVATVRGVGMAVGAPAVNALAYDVAGRNRLLNAIGLLGAAETVSSILGGLAAGTLIAWAGVGPCYLAVGGSLAVSALAVVVMGHVPRSKASQEAVWRSAWDGMKYTMGQMDLRSLLMMSLIMELFGFSFLIMLPVIARDVLDVGATGLGYLAAAGGVGALTASMVVTSLGDFRSKGLLVTLGGGASGLTLILFALSPWFGLSLVLAAALGGLLFAYDASMATLIQLVSSERMRGRVLGLYSMTWGFTPVGGFISGGIATVLGAPAAIGLGGGLILAYVLPASGGLRRIKEPGSVPQKETRPG
ncbi:MAG: MFS transporter [Dehalococcoidia bacterium]